jgi:hypothetical protein
MRTLVSRAFFDSAEAQLLDPDLAHPPGTPGFDPTVYNPAFVRHLYQNYLRRNPEPDALVFWVGVLNTTADYNGLVTSFITCPEYRQRDFAHIDVPGQCPLN